MQRSENQPASKPTQVDGILCREFETKYRSFNRFFAEHSDGECHE